MPMEAKGDSLMWVQFAASTVGATIAAAGVILALRGLLFLGVFFLPIAIMLFVAGFVLVAAGLALMTLVWLPWTQTGGKGHKADA